MILLQAIEATDFLKLLSPQELTVSAILLAAIYYFYKRTANLEGKIDEYIRQKDEDAKKYYEVIIKTNGVLDEHNRIANEHNKIMQRIEKLLDK